MSRPGFCLILARYMFLVGLLFTSSAHANLKNNQTLLNEVGKRLLEVTPRQNEKTWPPIFTVVEKQKPNSIGAWSIEGSVTVSTAMMQEVIQGDANRLAFVVGHELAHILLHHGRIRRARQQTPFVSLVFSREEELSADSMGMVLALRAGYSYRKGLSLQTRMIALGLEYSSFEGMALSHPSWKERLSVLDTNRARLWQSMSSFQNGTVFLRLEQYNAAAHCFRYVVEEFPECYEGWTNLGYALLMRYCDQLTLSDLRQYEIGHLVVGGFFRRPASLEMATRGKDASLWNDAVSAFVKALRLDSTLTLAYANLGVCYLLHPQGKSDLLRAKEYLERAAAAVYSDSGLDPESRFAVLVNSGVVEFAAGQRDRLMARLQDAERSVGQHTKGNALSGPLTFNKALYFSTVADGSKKPDAVELFQEYLKSVTPAWAWWDLAYERYVSLCQDLNRSPEDLSVLQKRLQARYRPVISLRLGEADVSLLDNIRAVRKQLGNAESAPLLRGSRLTITRYVDLGVSFLANDNLLAIILTESSACRIPLVPSIARAPDQQIRVLHVGMSSAELDTLLGVTSYDQREFIESGKFYRYYRRIGVGILLREKVVSEIIIAQIPEAQVGF